MIAQNPSLYVAYDNFDPYTTMIPFASLKGNTLVEIWMKKEENVILMATSDNKLFLWKHTQSCCEDVSIKEISGNLQNLIGSELIVADEKTSHTEDNNEYESSTWSFYTLRTLQGFADVSWFGSSNGYYSETVDLYQVDWECCIKDFSGKHYAEKDKSLTGWVIYK